MALGQSLDWTDEDAREFWHDLELYEKLSAPDSGRQYGRATRVRASGPFVDRVALLLDPSLMEQARQAAGKFQLELNEAADRVLRKIFSRRAAELGARFEHNIERRFRGTTNALESGCGQHVCQPRLAGLGAEPESHFLR